MDYQAYEAPAITRVGSVADLTQGLNPANNSDNNAITGPHGDHGSDVGGHYTS